MIPRTLIQLQKALPEWDCSYGEVWPHDRWRRLCVASMTEIQAEVEILFPLKRAALPVAMAAAYRAAKTFERGE